MAVFQVCFTAGFAEEGKGSREGYSIYYYARAGARASGACKKIRKGENSCRMERKRFPKGWNSLSDDTKKIRKYFPRKGKNVRPDGKFIPENVDFSAGKFQKKRENDENGEKNFFLRSGKNIKIIPMTRKNMSETG